MMAGEGRSARERAQLRTRLASLSLRHERDGESPYLRTCAGCSPDISCIRPVIVRNRLDAPTGRASRICARVRLRRAALRQSAENAALLFQLLDDAVEQRELVGADTETVFEEHHIEFQIDGSDFVIGSRPTGAADTEPPPQDSPKGGGKTSVLSPKIPASVIKRFEPGRMPLLRAKQLLRDRKRYRTDCWKRDLKDELISSRRLPCLQLNAERDDHVSALIEQNGTFIGVFNSRLEASMDLWQEFREFGILGRHEDKAESWEVVVSSRRHWSIILSCECPQAPLAESQYQRRKAGSTGASGRLL